MSYTIIAQKDTFLPTQDTHLLEYEDDIRKVSIEYFTESECIHVKSLNKQTNVGLKYGMNYEGMKTMATLFVQTLDFIDELKETPDAT